MNVMPPDTGLIHFTGIGGIGMSGIVEILHATGYAVQGSDVADGANVQRLRAKDIPVFVGHDATHIENAAVLVVSSAVRADNPELVAARARKIPVVRRADMLAELMRLRRAIAIGGTHGKTTTTSLVGAILEEGAAADPALDPTVINGGIVNRYGTNTRLGKGAWMVVESDESDGTFTRLPATIAVVTNIDPEHLDHYGNFDAVRAAYRQFVENVPFYGFAVLCTDHPEVQALAAAVSDRRIVTCGLNPQADVRAANIRPDAEGSAFDVTFTARDGAQTVLRDVYLSMPGEHNVRNALAALAIARELGIAPPLMKKALAGFSGVKRRFTKTGEACGVTVIDDYGHHPVEIAAALKTARQVATGRIIAVVQPHRYTRLRDLMGEFATAFNDADTVLVADVYTAGEAPIPGTDRDALVAAILSHGHRDARALPSPEVLPALLAAFAQPGDMVVCLGAGDITKWAHALPDVLQNRPDTVKKIKA